MLAIHHHDKTGFFAIKKLFNHDAVTGIAKRVARQHIVNGRFGFIQRHRDDNAFARRQTVSFDNNWRAFFTDIRERRFRLGKVLVFRRRNTMARQEIFGKRFGAFQLCGAFGRPEYFQTGGAECIHHADNQRRFRPDDGQIDIFTLRKTEQRRNIRRVDSDVLQCRLQRGACVTWRDIDGFNQRRLDGFPGQRMFAPAVANN
ncbi:hypothetical protein BN135_2825 [Cronobacter muytjensii 530]